MKIVGSTPHVNFRFKICILEALSFGNSQEKIMLFPRRDIQKHKSFHFGLNPLRPGTVKESFDTSSLMAPKHFTFSRKKTK